MTFEEANAWCIEEGAEMTMDGEASSILVVSARGLCASAVVIDPSWRGYEATFSAVVERLRGKIDRRTVKSSQGRVKKAKRAPVAQAV
jgi:hypothetical protein